MKKEQKQKTTTEKQAAGDYTIPVTEMADKAMKNYEHALRTGLKFQEGAGKWWSSMFNQASVAQDWQKRVNDMTGMATSFMPVAQRRMEEVIELMEKNSKTGTELVKKAVDAAQTHAVSGSQGKWLELWTSSLGAVRSNAEAVSEINSKAIDSWIEFVRKNTEVTEVRVPKIS